MAKGSVYTCERIIMRDLRSGLRITRLTHGPSIATNLYFEMCSFSLDERYVVFVAQRYAGRDAPWDIFRCTTDGIDLRQPTDAGNISGVTVSPAADKIFFVSGGVLHAIGIHTLEEEEIVEVPAKTWVEPRSIAAVDGAGKNYFAMGYNAQGRGVLIKVNLETAPAEVLHESERQNHITVDWSDSVVSFNDWRPNGVIPSLVNTDGTGYRAQAFPKFAHNTWFGTKQTIQGTLVPPGHALATFTEGDAEPRALPRGATIGIRRPEATDSGSCPIPTGPRKGSFFFTYRPRRLRMCAIRGRRARIRSGPIRTLRSRPTCVMSFSVRI